MHLRMHVLFFEISLYSKMNFLFFKNHKSIWYSLKDYALNVKEDIFIRKFLEKNLAEAIITDIEIKKHILISDTYIDVYVLKSSVLMQKEGLKLFEIKKNLSNLLTKNFSSKTLTINIVEIDNPESNSKIIAGRMKEQLEQRVPFKRVMNSAVKKAKLANIKGIKVQIAGRLNGAEIARTEWIREGQIPLHTIKADIDYCHYTARMIKVKLINLKRVKFLLTSFLLIKTRS